MHSKLLFYFLIALIVVLATPLILIWYSHGTPIAFWTAFVELQDSPELETPYYLEAEESVIVEVPNTATTSTSTQLLPIKKVMFEYIEVVDGCGPHFEGECLNVRSGPGTDYSVVTQLRTGIVLKIDGSVERGGVNWYKVVFDEWLLYPDRVKSDWYVHEDFVKILYDEGEKTTWEDDYSTTTQKQIIVDRSEQMLRAYEGDEMVIETKISTGLELTPTPRGTFTIFKKTPSRYMQGPLPHLIDRSYYDLPGVPWNLYFTEGGAVIHGAYWHDSFGNQYSHGCVNVPLDIARKIYNWSELGTKVIVQD